MKNLTTSEKIALLRYHGGVLERAFQAITTNRKSDLLEHAERAAQIIKSIPKYEFSPEE